MRNVRRAPALQPQGWPASSGREVTVSDAATDITARHRYSDAVADAAHIKNRIGDDLMKAKALGLALALSCGLLATSALTASAAPLGASTLTGAGVSNSAVELAQFKKKRYNQGYKNGYRAGSRHSRAPRNWRRYGARPGDWRTRGCIIVGPIWYCP